MFGIDAVNIFDGKIVDHKEECDRAGGMTEKARCGSEHFCIRGGHGAVEENLYGL